MDSPAPLQRRHGVGTPLCLEQFELGGRQPGNFHLGQGLEVLVGPLAGLATDNGHDTLLGDEELPLRENAQRVVEPQPLHLGPVVVTTAQRLVPQPDQLFVSPFAHNANIIDFHLFYIKEVPIFHFSALLVYEGNAFRPTSRPPPVLRLGHAQRYGPPHAVPVFHLGADKLLAHLRLVAFLDNAHALQEPGVAGILGHLAQLHDAAGL